MYNLYSFFSAYPIRGCAGTGGCCSTGWAVCGFGEGDCDADSECRGNLKCGSENCHRYTLLDIVNYFSSSDDCCR